jgi:5'-nucleotidase
VQVLRALGTVRVVLPAAEQSWKGKAMSRFGRVAVKPYDGVGVEGFVVEGTPADCVNLGVHSLFADPPDWVISGINIGDNVGLAFSLNSGTVGAAFEGALLGLPSVAFSHHVTYAMYREWSTEGCLSGPEAERAVQQAAAAVGRLMPAILAHGLPEGAMLLNINFPKHLAPETPVRWTRLQNNRYGALFEPDGDGYRHRYRGDAWREPGERNDRDVVESGAISVTALTLGGMNVAGLRPYSFS